MQELTPEGQQIIQNIAQRHGVSTDAVRTLLRALVASQGVMAQFSHPELGGMGQWSQGGMIMVGDMFNQGSPGPRGRPLHGTRLPLAHQPSLAVAASRRNRNVSPAALRASACSLPEPGRRRGAWWPAELGSPSSVGAQNDLRYAVFPTTHRLAIERAGRVTLYDTGDHVISGMSQQQSADQSLTFTSQRGVVRVADLPVVQGEGPRSVPSAEVNKPEPQPTPATASQAAVSPPPSAEGSSAICSQPSNVSPNCTGREF